MYSIRPLFLVKLKSVLFSPETEAGICVLHGVSDPADRCQPSSFGNRCRNKARPCSCTCFLKRSYNSVFKRTISFNETAINPFIDLQRDQRVKGHCNKTVFCTCFHHCENMRVLVFFLCLHTSPFPPAIFVIPMQCSFYQELMHQNTLLRGRALERDAEVMRHW